MDKFLTLCLIGLPFLFFGFYMYYDAKKKEKILREWKDKFNGLNIKKHLPYLVHDNSADYSWVIQCEQMHINSDNVVWIECFVSVDNLMDLKKYKAEFVYEMFNDSDKYTVNKL